MVSRGWGGGGGGEQGDAVERVHSGELMYSMMIIVNSTDLYTWKLMVDPKFSHQEKKEKKKKW